MINCRVGQCMIIKSGLIELVDQTKLIVQKEKVEGRYFDAVATTDKNLGKPAFLTVAEAKQEIINNKNMSFPIISDENELIATIQVEAVG